MLVLRMLVLLLLMLLLMPVRFRLLHLVFVPSVFYNPKALQRQSQSGLRELLQVQRLRPPVQVLDLSALQRSLTNYCHTVVRAPGCV